jgi:sorbitol-specific phosphotransferase system component IIA
LVEAMKLGRVIYSSVVRQVGREADTFFRHGMIVLFGDGTSPELCEGSVTHSPTAGGGRQEVVVPGDRIAVGDEILVVRAVGELASKNLFGSGHITIVVEGIAGIPAIKVLPGSIHCAGSRVPPMSVGTQLAIVR